MPRNKINYQNIVIYQICCKDLNIKDILIGYTTDLTKRKCLYRNHVKSTDEKYAYNKLYNFIRGNGGWENFDIVEIEKFPCNDSFEAKARERYWIEHKFNNQSVTPERPIVTPEEKYDKRKEYTRKYNRENKEYFRKYYQENKEKFKAKTNVQQIIDNIEMKIQNQPVI